MVIEMRGKMAWLEMSHDGGQVFVGASSESAFIERGDLGASSSALTSSGGEGGVG